ncbi:YIP1 family protein [Pseudoruegeria sp. SK021]|uniref:YIP1 family protein n=1 Tax=Pseudoruegeria sp. SK021 TaxID=1933035 RepID=UPI000A259750|nr:YIP1 family protein [Pseudoruegeria sp. SK021]OSP55587.1 hypothetical protein BV911_06900 [Pseudoruegeria sp. SK021]
MTPQHLEFSLPALTRAAIATMTNPQEGARLIMAQKFSGRVLWLGLQTVVVVSVLMLYIHGLALVLRGDVEGPVVILASPFAMCVLMFAILAVVAVAIHRIGRAFGGTGQFYDSLALIVWLQVVLLGVQTLQTVVVVISPLFADLIGIVGLVMFLWLLTNFVAVQHGFKALTPVFVMIVVSTFGLVFALTLLLTLVGVITPGVPNV